MSGILMKGNVLATGEKEQEITAKNMTVTVGTKKKPLNAKAKSILTYESLNKKTIHVDKNGNITAKQVGQGRIRITAQQSKQYKAAEKVIKVTVRPKKTSIKTLKIVNGNQIKVVVKKVTNADGYQIRYSSAQNGKGTKIKNTKGSKTIKNLKEKMNYYIQVRSYQKVKGKIYYSAWNKASAIKTKNHIHSWDKHTHMKLKQGYACNSCYTDVTDYEDRYACHGGWHTHQWCIAPETEYCDCGAKLHRHTWSWMKPSYGAEKRGYYFCWSCFNFSDDGINIDNSIQKDCNMWDTPYDFKNKNYILEVYKTEPADYTKYIESINLTKTIMQISPGETYKFSYQLTPEDPDVETEITWESSNPKIATVDKNGKVKGISEGKAEIIVKTAEGKKDICQLSVSKQKDYEVLSADITVDGKVITDSSITLKAGTEHIVSLNTNPKQAYYEVKYHTEDISTIGQSIWRCVVNLSGSSLLGSISEHGASTGTLKYTNPETAIEALRAGTAVLTVEIKDVIGNVIIKKLDIIVEY